MPIPFTCPYCGAKTDVAEQYAGQSGPCAACGKTITVPPLVGAPGPRMPGQGSQAAIVVVILIVVVGLFGLLVCGGLLFWRTGASAPARVAPTAMPAPVSQVSTCVTTLQRIGLAMHNYHDVYNCFPPAYIPDQSGKPMHSWRVLLLPYMGQDALYKRYNLDEPWDSPNNLALASMISAVYTCPDDWQSNPTQTGYVSQTSYVMIVGPGTISDGPTATKLADIRDGATRTIMVVEVTNSGIQWMEPRDLKAEEISFGINDGTPNGIRTQHPEGANVLFCDGSVRTLPQSTDPTRIKAMTTVSGGEVVGEPLDEF
jgi:prepilin-type processing-associated H-X9-DG protein